MGRGFVHFMLIFLTIMALTQDSLLVMFLSALALYFFQKAEEHGVH